MEGDDSFILSKNYILVCIRNLFIHRDKCISYDKSWNGWRLSIPSFRTLIILIEYLKL